MLFFSSLSHLQALRPLSLLDIQRALRYNGKAYLRINAAVLTAAWAPRNVIEYNRANEERQEHKTGKENVALSTAVCHFGKQMSISTQI